MAAPAGLPAGPEPAFPLPLAPSAGAGGQPAQPPAGAPRIPPPGGPRGGLGGRGAPRGRRAAGLRQELRGLEDITRLSAGGVARSSGGGPGGGRAGRGDGPATKRALFCAPPGAGTNGLAAAEVICQAAPGVRPGEGAAGAVCAALSRAALPGALRQVAAPLAAAVRPSVPQERSLLPGPPLKTVVSGWKR